jgi:hypothetical protein
MAYNNPSVADFKAFFFRDFPYTSDINTGVVDQDIAKAFQQANLSVNQELWGDQSSFSMAYLYMAAHWLVIDLRAAQGVGGQYNWVTTSKSVGSVSESFQIPQRILDNPELAMLAQTNYGAKYLQMVLPQLTGQVFSVCGTTRAL